MVNWVFVSLAGFAILHSILASMRVKDAIRRWIGDRAYLGWYRVLYNAVSTITFAPVLLILALTPGRVIWQVSGTGMGILVVAQIAAFIGLIAAGSQIDLWRLAGLRQLRAYILGDALPLPPEPFVQRGMYGLVRHPLYACIIVILWAVPAMHAANLAFVSGTTIYFIVGAYLEERRLIAEMGDTYRRYREQVPFLIPFVHLPPAACCMGDQVGDGRGHS